MGMPFLNLNLEKILLKLGKNSRDADKGFDSKVLEC